MNIFMCVNYPIYNSAIGLSKKVASQIENLKKLGFDITFTSYSKDGIRIYNNECIVHEKKYPKVCPSNINKLFRRFWLMKETRFYFEKNKQKYDIGFIRWGAIDQSFIKTIKVMDLYCNKIMMDCHGYHKNFKGNTLKGLYIEKTTKHHYPILSSYIDLCLTETKEEKIFSIPALPMDTGIDIDKYTPHCYCGKADEIHMISVASEQPYHGYDRIIKGLANSRDEKVFLHLVGKMSKKTIKLAKKKGLEKKVFLHGYQTGKALNDIYNLCNIGVGPLAPHRSGGKEGTGIKTKEYFAIGLPYFYAGQELLVPNDYPYVLKIKADDSPIDIEIIKEFYNRIKKAPDIQNRMRSFAAENYSWEKIFSKALELLYM